MIDNMIRQCKLFHITKSRPASCLILIFKVSFSVQKDREQLLQKGSLI